MANWFGVLAFALSVIRLVFAKLKCFFLFDTSLPMQIWHIPGLNKKKKHINSVGHMIKSLQVFRVIISLLNQLVVTAL